MSLEKEFLPYPEAMELKELEYDEPCFGLFVRDKSLLIKEIPNQEECEMFFGGILAPTFSQAFRWFREKHELECCLKMNYDILNSRIMYLNGKEICRFIIGDKKWELMDRDSEAYKMNPSYYEKTYTYEEAELACLRKLIEIVKNGK